MDNWDFDQDTEDDEITSEEIEEFVNSVEEDFQHPTPSYGKRDISQFIKSLFGEYNGRIGCFLTGNRVDNKSGDVEKVEQWVDEETDYSPEAFEEILEETVSSQDYRRYSIRKTPPFKTGSLFDPLAQIADKMREEGEKTEVFGKEHFMVEVPKEVDEFDSKDIGHLYNQGYLGREKENRSNTYFTQGGYLYLNDELYQTVLDKMDDENAI